LVADSFSAFHALMRAAVICSSDVSAPNAALSWCRYNLSNATDFFRDFAARHRSTASLNVMLACGFSGSICSSALASSASASSWVHSALYRRTCFPLIWAVKPQALRLVRWPGIFHSRWLTCAIG